MSVAGDADRASQALPRDARLLIGFISYLGVCLVLLLWLRSLAGERYDYRSLQILYVAIATAGLVLFFAVACVIALRNRKARSVETAKLGAPADSMRQVLARHKWLLWTCGIALCIYGCDRVTPIAVEFPIAYIAVVFLSLRSRQESDTWLTAAMGTVLTVAALLQATWVDDMWAVLANRTVEIFVIWSAALLGRRQGRMAKQLGSALSEARTARGQNIELQNTLARSEATGVYLDNYRKFIDTVAAMARVGGWEFDIATNKPRWSQEVFRIHEVDPADAPTLERALSFFPGDARELMDRSLNQLLTAGTAFDTTLPFVTALGNKRWVRAIGKAERSPKGVIVRAWGALQDITEQYEAQRRLARTSFSGSDGHWEIDFASGIIWTSAGFEALLGFGSSDRMLPIAGIPERVHPQDAELDRLAFESHVAKGTAYDIRIRLRTADDQWRWFRLRGQVERNSIGRPRRFGGTASDVHVEEVTRHELQLVQGRLERATLGTQDGLWEMNLREHRLWTAPQFRDLLGYDKQDLNEDVFARLVHPDDTALLQPLLERDPNLPPLVDIEVRLRTRGGEYRWYRIRAISVRGEQHEVVTMSGSIQDISLQKRSEKVLIDAREVEAAANRAKSGFLANMSHEIRTPMNGVLGMTELLLASELRPEQRHFAETVRSSARSLLSIINDILDLSKIEAGKMGIAPIRSELRQCVDDVALTLSTQAKAKDCELSVTIDADVPVFVVLDPDRLRQVLLNLCGNAIKFTPGGKVTVEVALSSSQLTACVLRFSVRDSGIGMTPEVLQRLFQPYSQADAETTRIFGGTGLGLSIVQQLVRLMGGEVSVSSSLGVGSEFSFTLPCGIPTSGLLGRSPRSGVLPEGKVGGLQRAGLGRRALILVAEDNPVNQQITTRFIQMQGLDIVLVDDGSKAVDASAAQSFDLILMDVQMPVMDGLAATRAIRKREIDGGRLHIPIVALTASAMTEEIQQCLAAGMDEVLTKPLELGPFRATLDRYGLTDTDHDLQVAIGEGTGPSAPSTDSIQVLDISALRTMLDNDERVIEEFSQMLVTSSEALVSDLRLALGRIDRSALRRLAHKLKGASSSMHAHNLWLGASRLEAAAGGANLDALQVFVDDIASAADACADLIGKSVIARAHATV